MEKMEQVLYHPVYGKILDIINIGALRLDPLNFSSTPHTMNNDVLQYIQAVNFKEDELISVLFQIRRLNNYFLRYFIMESDRLFQFEHPEDFFFNFQYVETSEFLSKLLCFVDRMQHRSSYYREMLAKRKEDLVPLINGFDNLTNEDKRKLLSIIYYA